MKNLLFYWLINAEKEGIVICLKLGLTQFDKDLRR